MSDNNVSVQSASVRCPNRVPEIEFLIWLLDGSLVIGEDGTLGCREYLCWRRGQGASIWWSICTCCTLSISTSSTHIVKPESQTQNPSLTKLTNIFTKSDYIIIFHLQYYIFCPCIYCFTPIETIYKSYDLIISTASQVLTCSELFWPFQAICQLLSLIPWVMIKMSQ